LLRTHPLPTSTLFPYTTLFRSPRLTQSEVQMLLRVGSNNRQVKRQVNLFSRHQHQGAVLSNQPLYLPIALFRPQLSDHVGVALRSEEHTSELQSRENLVCRLLL